MATVGETEEELKAIMDKIKSKKKERRRKKKEQAINNKILQASTTGLNRFMTSDITIQQENLKTSDPQVRAQNNLATIVEYLKLKNQESEAACTVEQIFNDTKINLGTEERVCEMLRKHDKIEYKYGKYRFKPQTEASDENQLLNTMRDRLFVTRKELDGNKDAEKNAKKLVEEDIIKEFPSNEGRDKVYFFYDTELRDANPNDSFRELWRRQEIPDADDTRDELCKKYNIKFIEALDEIKYEDYSEENQKKRKRSSRKQNVNQSILDGL
jgi:hypothetical protein